MKSSVTVKFMYYFNNKIKSTFIESINSKQFKHQIKIH